MTDSIVLLDIDFLHCLFSFEIFLYCDPTIQIELLSGKDFLSFINTLVNLTTDQYNNNTSCVFEAKNHYFQKYLVPLRNLSPNGCNSMKGSVTHIFKVLRERKKILT